MRSIAVRRTGPLAALPLLLGAIAPLPAQEAPDLQSLVSTIPVRSIGPAVMSGRVVDIAVAGTPGEPGYGTEFYIAAASGGVWKTTDGGVTFDPVFDDAPVSSIGAVAVAPSARDIVWIGTGEDNNQRSSSYGDGVYRSTDGGETWRHMGLRESQHVGKIRVHPTDPLTVWVAAVGPLWGPGGDRGVYRSTDGGETWDHVLSVDEHTGAADIVLDPADPSTLYVAMQQRERRAYSYISGGPGSGIWKSTDGGDSWTELTGGLPEGDMGRIGLDVSRSHPQTVYAVIEGDAAGVYRSDNGGLSWRRTSDIQSIPWYFGEIRVDPTDPETVYHLGVPLQRSRDGGVTWERATDGSVHVDHHALWIDPTDPDHLILGNDGGLYVSRSGGASWDFSNDLPISQFYAVGYDFAEPFFGVYGGLQDNNTWGGPSRTRNAVGIRNADWFVMAGGDGFYAVVDPTDPNIAYVESQNGGILRFDRRTGDRKGIRPEQDPDLPDFRYNWSAPIVISPWDSDTIWFAANHVFRSPDRGDSWEIVSDDLTQQFDRDSLPMFGGIPDDDAVARHSGVAPFGNISDLDVSAVERGVVVAGTDDGVVAVTSDDGTTWTRTTSFPGVPDTTYVSKVRASQHDADVVYATFDGHRSNDFRPYVLKSTDRGASWTSIAANLPEFGNVRAFAEHHDNPDLLFVGTEFAVFASIDGGGSWSRIDNGMPPVRVDDVKIHPRDNALIIGTHGRGIYLIDDLGPLQHLAEARAAGAPFLMPVQPQMVFTPDRSVSTGTTGNRDYTGDNPPVGATVSYLLPQRAADVRLEIVDGGGAVVRTLDAAGAAGLHHVPWDFRADAPWSGPPEEPQGGGGFGFGGGQGPLVVPGAYTARLTVGETVLERPVEARPDPMVILTMAQLRELYDLRVEHLGLNARLQIAQRAVADAREEVQGMEAALDAHGSAPEALGEQVSAALREIEAARQMLGSGGRFGGGGDSVQGALSGAFGIHSATVMPTAAERAALERGAERLPEAEAAVDAVVTGTLPELRAALDAAGVPWTPGRGVGGGEG
ncbi:MAG: hypothetical protein RLN75_00095 [Longimicrobiales bacterium]